MMECPRTLLLTWQRPDGRYAGAEAVRKTLSALPAEKIRWAYLGAQIGGAPPDGLARTEGFEPRHINWRLRNSALRYVYEQHWQAGGLARRIAAWARPFQPQVLWLLAEMGAVTVGRRLQTLLRIPVHVTVHDAYEFARLALPRRYYPIYRRSAMKLLQTCASLDTVAPELTERLRDDCPALRTRPSLVFPSSIGRRDMQSGVPGADDGAGAPRRIALCGSMRIEEWQWREFLEGLAGLPWTFEILAFVDRAAFFATPLPSNVRLRFQAYAATEADLVKRLAEAGVWACYLGVSRKPEDAVFSLYSFSSKLTAYAAAGLPSLVDAPAGAAVWRRVQTHAAGLRYDGNEASRLELKEFFTDGGARRRLGQGALRLCRAELDLDSNVGRFAKVLAGDVEQLS